jgi:wyosine [tRNA(Phe)-imidazoG37] synthetase (radical SAM superfamily)
MHHASRQTCSEQEKWEAASTIYGPVRSWRAGLSLGVDLLFVNSICSFRCVYCQLGKINVHTVERKIYVPTERVMSDLKQSAWKEADVITLSGSGEPTLASNMGEVIREIKRYTRKPVLVLTNATTLNDWEVRRELSQADIVFCKLDAVTEEGFRMINRPVEGITLRSIIAGIKKFKSEYAGRLSIQVMLMRFHQSRVEQLTSILNEIRPDEVQLNVPLRAIPREWFLDARANSRRAPSPAIYPKAVGREDVARFEASLRQLTGLKIISVYQ